MIGVIIDNSVRVVEDVPTIKIQIIFLAGFDVLLKWITED